MKSFWQKFMRAAPVLALFFILIDLYLIIVYAPEEAMQGLAQKIFYFHVSSAFSMYMGFATAGVGALLFIWKRENRFNALSQAGASVGLLFCAMVLVSGPIWAKPIWGAWWTWDPRLTTTLILFLGFFAVRLLRDFYGIDPRGRLYASVFTLFCMLDIPLVVFAVKLWRGVHPAVLGEKDSMPFEMKITLFTTLFTVMFLMLCLLVLKTRQLILKDRLEEFVSKISERND